MNKRFKIIVGFSLIISAIFLGVFLFLYIKKDEPFLLINQVEETDIAIHADFLQVIKDADRLANQTNAKLAYRIVLAQVKGQLLKSGTKLENVFITYSPEKEKELLTFYMEIEDTSIFNPAFKQLQRFLQLREVEKGSDFYVSKTNDISVERFPEYIKMHWGKGRKLEQEKGRKKIASELFKELLSPVGTGVINLTGGDAIDSTEYATFSYSYRDSMRFNVNWIVKGNHPLKMKQEQIPIYASQKKSILAYTNFDAHHFHEQLNPLVKNQLYHFFPKISKEIDAILDYWNGVSSICIGGNVTEEIVQYTTEFDDDFNPIEKKVVRKDNRIDMGSYWGTKAPEETLSLVNKLPNVEIKEDELISLFLPRLKIETTEDALRFFSIQTPYDTIFAEHLAYLQIQNDEFRGEIKIDSRDEHTVTTHLVVTDLNNLFSIQKVLMNLLAP